MIGIHVLNQAVNITVSDPWEFGTECGTGPFAGAITNLSAEALIIQLRSPVPYRGRVFRRVLARPRHAGDVPSKAGVAPLFANLWFLSSDVQPGSEFGPDVTRDGLAAVGTVEPAVTK
jgi:hypothetical protein